MRNPKRNGNYVKPHGADKCGVCAKPKKHRKNQILKDKLKTERESR